MAKGSGGTRKSNTANKQTTSNVIGNLNATQLSSYKEDLKKVYDEIKIPESEKFTRRLYFDIQKFNKDVDKFLDPSHEIKQTDLMVLNNNRRTKYWDYSKNGKHNEEDDAKAAKLADAYARLYSIVKERITKDGSLKIK